MSDLNDYQIIKVGDLPVAETLEGLNILGFDSTNNRAVRALMALLKGLDGKPVELQKTATHLQWRVEGGTWTNLLTLDEIKGAPGDNISLQKTATHIQWKLGAGTWVDLVALAELKGDTGANIELQKSATHVQWRVAGASTWNNLILLEDLKVKGDKGDPNTLSIGTVQGGASAGASITGTAPNQTLNLTLPKGDRGANIELQKTTTHVQWKVVGGTWANLIPLSDLKGEQGDNISLQKTATHIQWRLGTGTWTNLVALTELKGDTGANIELQKSATHVQWRVQGTTTWNNLILIDDLKVKGDTGANIELQKSTTHVQWRVVGTSTWTNLVTLTELKGEKGDAPVKGVDYFDGKNAVMTIGTITTVASNAQADATVVADGVDVEGKPKFKLNLWLPKGVDGEGAGDMLKSVYDPTGKNADVFGYVDNKVKTDVPENAKFTDTTYTEITEAEIDTGTASTLRTITARRITYILNKAQTLINNAIGALTKSSVGLGNVDNVKQASKTEFETHNSDSTRHITSSERTAWNAKGSSNLALGETSATAYRGDRGKTAYDHSQTAHAPSTAQKNSDITKAEIEAKLTGAITTHSHTVTKANVGLGNVDDTSDANKPVSTAMQTALNGKLDANKMQVVTELPASPVSGTFYFVKE